MYKLVIFDLDGTLLDTSRTIQSVLNESLNKFGLPPVPLEKTKEYVGNGARVLVERAVGGREELIEAVYAHYSKSFAVCSNELTALYAGAAECLIKLRENGVKLAIVTNKPERATQKVYKEFLSRFCFDAVVGQTAGVPLKPDPQSTLNVIDALKVSKKDCLFVGDGETDVLTAANAGIDCVSALWGFRTEKQLKAAGAKRFAKSFNELEDFILNR